MTAQEAFNRFTPATAWDAYYPNTVNPWDTVKVAHLYRRAAFGASWEQIQSGLESTPDELVTQLVRGGDGQDEFESEAERLEQGALDSGQPAPLKAAWFYRLLHSPHPLREKLTLFWHNHFATSNAKVADLRLMQRQIATLRQHALGHFGEMLHAVTRDPAMLVWLDSDSNRKGQPNENYAREVFELFSLGVGNYTEKDIKEAARALTGWSVRDGAPAFNPRQHDGGEKTILGQTGRWGAGDVVRIALSQPACSRFLVRKLFRELVSETVKPSEEMFTPLGDEFRIRDYDIGWLVERMLRSWVFYSPATIRQRVKSPVEFAAGSVRSLEGNVGPQHLAELCDQLGQSVYFPPSVKGWDGGSAWINSSTLLLRQNFAFDLTRGTGRGAACDPARLARKYDLEGNEGLLRFFLQLLQQQPDHPSLPEMQSYLREERAGLQRRLYSRDAIDGMLARSAAHLVMTLPEYQLG